MRDNKKQKAQELKDKYPNEGVITEGRENQVSPDNYFANHDLRLYRRKYLKFSYLMELLHQELELDYNTTSLEVLIRRIQDMVIASRREE